MSGYRGLFYARALALGTVLLATCAGFWTAGWLLGVSPWWGAPGLWIAASLWGALCWSAWRTYQRTVYDLRAREKGTQRLTAGVRGTNVVRFYDPPSAERLQREWNELHRPDLGGAS